MASAASGTDYKFTTQLEILDGGNGTQDPYVLETWSILGCYLKTANYNTLNYGTSEAVTIAMTIAFDNAVQEFAGSPGPVGAINPKQTRLTSPSDNSTATGAGAGQPATGP
jgi:hypothetical protein